MTECCLTCLVLLPGSDNKPVPDDLRGLEASWGSQKSFWNEVLLSDQQEDFQVRPLTPRRPVQWLKQHGGNLNSFSVKVPVGLQEEQLAPQVSIFSFSQNPTLLPRPSTRRPVRRPQLGFHRAGSSYPPHISQVISNTPPSADLSVPSDRTRSHTHTHTPVDTQNGGGHRQHARGTGGDHAVKWSGILFLWLFIGGVGAL